MLYFHYFLVFNLCTFSFMSSPFPFFVLFQSLSLIPNTLLNPDNGFNALLLLIPVSEVVADADADEELSE